MQHEVINGGIREAEKHLVCHCLCQFVVLKQIRKQPISIISADSAQNHVDIRVAESLQKVFCSLLGVLSKKFQPHESIRHELYVQAIFL